MGLNVLFITHLYAPSIGGAERLFGRIAEGLARRGRDVTVLTSDALSTEQFFTRAENRLPRREVLNGVRIIRAPIRAPIYGALKLFDKTARRLGRLGVFFRPFVFGPHFTRSFRELLATRFDTVVAGPVPTTAIYYGLLFRRLSRSSRLVFVPCLHTRDKLHTAIVNRLALRRADLVLILSEDEKDYLVRKGVRRDRVFRIVAAVDDLLLDTPRSVPPLVKAGAPFLDYVLYLGQEGEHKRIPLLLKAMTAFWDGGRTTPLVIAGARTRYSETIDRIIAALPERHRDRIIRLGDFAEPDKVGLLDGCRVLVNPSSNESFGIVFLEAWARRKPVIGARVKAVRDLIRDGESGLLFEDRNAADLQAKIRTVLENPNLARRMGETGHEDVRSHYRWDLVIDSLARSL